MREIRAIFLAAMILILIGILIFFLFNSVKITGEAIKRDYTYTKAICNETNYCEDYEITCQGNETVRINPTGAIIQFSDDWKDPRDKEIIEKTC